MHNPSIAGERHIVGEVFDKDGNCLDPAVVKRICSVAGNVMGYMERNICPAISLEAMVREREAEMRGEGDLRIRSPWLYLTGH